MKVFVCVAVLASLLQLDIAVASLLPRSPKGGSGGGGGGGGRGGGSGGSSGSNRGSTGSVSSGGTGSRGANTGRGGSGDTGHPPIVYTAFSSRSANYFSFGGGKRFTLPSNSPFAGREMGGGTRPEVPGTARYGSGYAYYTNSPQTRAVYGNPFPFAFWPVPFVYHGYGNEYGQHNHTVDEQRPGGALSMVNLAPIPNSGWNVTTINGVNETYWMVGDKESVTTMLSLLVDTHHESSDTFGCSVQNATILPFNSSEPADLPFHFENMIQWYRSSSFGLAFTGYNNTYALAPLNETTPLDQSTPLPTQLVYSPYLQCINNTLVEGLPILDGDPPAKLSGGAIAGIVIGSVVGAILLGVAGWFTYKAIKTKKMFPKKG